MPKFGASLTVVIDNTAKAKANETFRLQVSLTIDTYDCKNIFTVQAA